MLQGTLSPSTRLTIFIVSSGSLRTAVCTGTGVVFGSGSHDNSVCPSLACLDVKMYNFLNSEACICTVQDLHTIRALSSAAQAQLKITLIGDNPPHAPM